jgi:hypothetical protein
MRSLTRLSVGITVCASLWSSARAQLLWPGPEPGDPTRAITIGLAMNHGVAGIGFNQAIPHTPMVVGVGGSPFGYAVHVDLGLPRLRYPASLFAAGDADMRTEPYVSVGLLALPRHNEHAAGGLWLFECGVRGWPRARRGLYWDGALGVMRPAYGDVGALAFLPLPSFRLLAGVAF